MLGFTGKRIEVNAFSAVNQSYGPFNADEHDIYKFV